MNFESGDMAPLEIGGYFGLDLPDYGDHFPAMLKFQSARAALRMVLESLQVKQVWLPAYICNAVVKAVTDANATINTYLLDATFYPKNLPENIPDGCVFIYVNYFGLCQGNISRIAETIPADRLIIDNSQGLFSKPGNAVATLYSPRKFVGLPDGGMLAANDVRIGDAQLEDTGSIFRMQHLLMRLAYPSNSGYPFFLESEQSLSDTKPLMMSRLTKRLLSSINFAAVRRRRRENFLMLSSRLDRYNYFKWKFGPDTVPLCYPLLLDFEVAQMKSELLAKRIYIPAYWPELEAHVKPGGNEEHFVKRCLPVPCDHRYSLSQMSMLADVVVNAVNAQKKVN